MPTPPLSTSFDKQSANDLIARYNAGIQNHSKNDQAAFDNFQTFLKELEEAEKSDSDLNFPEEIDIEELRWWAHIYSFDLLSEDRFDTYDPEAAKQYAMDTLQYAFQHVLDTPQRSFSSIRKIYYAAVSFSIYLHGAGEGDSGFRQFFTMLDSPDFMNAENPSKDDIKQKKYALAFLNIQNQTNHGIIDRMFKEVDGFDVLKEAYLDKYGTSEPELEKPSGP